MLLMWDIWERTFVLATHLEELGVLLGEYNAHNRCRYGMRYMGGKICFLVSRERIIDEQARASLDPDKENCVVNEYQHNKTVIWP